MSAEYDKQIRSLNKACNLAAKMRTLANKGTEIEKECRLKEAAKLKKKRDEMNKKARRKRQGYRNKKIF